MIKIKGLDSEFPNVIHAEFAAVNPVTGKLEFDFPEIETDLTTKDDVMTALIEEVRKMWSTGRTLTFISTGKVSVNNGQSYLEIYISIPITTIFQGEMYGVCAMISNPDMASVIANVDVQRTTNADGSYTFNPIIEFDFGGSNNN